MTDYSYGRWTDEQDERWLKSVTEFYGDKFGVNGQWNPIKPKLKPKLKPILSSSIVKPETVKPETVKPETVKPETVKPKTLKEELELKLKLSPTVKPKLNLSTTVKRSELVIDWFFPGLNEYPEKLYRNHLVDCSTPGCDLCAGLKKRINRIYQPAPPLEEDFTKPLVHNHGRLIQGIEKLAAWQAYKVGYGKLVKLGWAAGKGLGKNEDGMLFPIKPHYGQRRQGLGYEYKRGDDSEEEEKSFFSRSEGDGKWKVFLRGATQPGSDKTSTASEAERRYPVTDIFGRLQKTVDAQGKFHRMLFRTKEKPCNEWEKVVANQKWQE